MHFPDYAPVWERLKEEYDCAHVRFKLTIFESASGAKTYRNQCVRCGATIDRISGAKLTAEEKDGAYTFDPQIAARWNASKDARRAVLMEEVKAACDRLNAAERDDWRQRHAAHLNSPEWFRIRLKVMKRANHTCEGCGLRPAEQVHHLTYKRLGREMLFDLVAICDECHGIVHETPTD